MGFFSDLKDDLSQAVNELVPEEGEVKEGEGKENNDIDLESLLNNIEEKEAEITEVSEQAPVQAEEKKVSVKATDETAVITAGMAIKGDINSTGSVELHGSVTGNITIAGKLNVLGTIEGDSKASEVYADGASITGEVNSLGSVKVGKNTVIIGNIYASSAVIAGAVKGDIDVHGPVILDTSAIVMGNIKSKSVQINNGAVIEGICSQCYADVSPTTFFDEIKKNRK